MLHHLHLGDAWAGNTVNTAIFRAHGLFSAQDWQFAAWYVDSRRLRILRRTLATGALRVHDLPGHYALDDAHHTISLGIDRRGCLHLAYGHHGSPLRYRRGLQPLAIDAWTGECEMTGVHEQELTYPSFLLPQAGRGLVFLYRDGRWDRGAARLKHFDEERACWHDLDPPLLDGRAHQPTANAYWNTVATPPDGSLHLSFVWRHATHHPTDQALDHRQPSYLRSMDGGVQWSTIDGHPCALPLRPGAPEPTIPLPPHVAPMNQCGMALDSQGRPHIAFHAPDGAGIPQVWHLHHDGRQWQAHAVTRRTQAFGTRGTGTLRLPISRPSIVAGADGSVYIVYRSDDARHPQRMVAQRLQPPYAAPDPEDLRVLWPEPLGFCEPVIDHPRWQRDGILSLLLQHNDQPDHDAPPASRVAPVHIAEWSLAALWQQPAPSAPRPPAAWMPRWQVRLPQVPARSPAKPPPVADDALAATVDIVVCVHDALEETTACVASLATAMRAGDRLLLVDDASGPTCAEALRAQAAAAPQRVQLLRLDGTPRGYCRAANHGLAHTRAPWVLLLNSDTLLCRSALEKMLRLAQGIPHAGIVGPLSNAAHGQSIPESASSAQQTAVNPLPDGVDTQGMDALCALWAQGHPPPQVPLVHGFCMLLRRSLVDTIGAFDEARFPQGYGEEYDFCLRAADAGYTLHVATDAFVYHAKSASYRDPERRTALMRAGIAALAARHGAARWDAALQATLAHPELARMRAAARQWIAQRPG